MPETNENTRSIPWRKVQISKTLETFFSGDWGNEPKPGNANVLRSTDITDDGRISSPGASRRIASSVLAKKGLRRGDTLLESSGGSTDRPVGRVAYFDGWIKNAICSNFFRTLRPLATVDPRFLFWKLHWYYRQSSILRFQQQTTGIINLKFAEYLQAQISIPTSFHEQTIIAHILDTLDNSIQETEANIEKLKAIKQGLLDDLLTRGVDENGKLRPPREEAPELYEDSKLGGIPKGWENPLLDDISERGSGHTPNKARKAYWDGGIKWVSLADSDKLDDIYIYTTAKQISQKGIDNSSAVLHPRGTTILSRDAGIGKSAILADDMAVSQHFITWRCSKVLNPIFLYYWLQKTKPQFEAIALGSTIKTIGLGFFKELRIVLPPKAEQDSIVSRILKVEDAIKTNQSDRMKLFEIKSALMDDLLTGRVRVTSFLAAHPELGQTSNSDEAVSRTSGS